VQFIFISFIRRKAIHAQGHALHAMPDIPITNYKLPTGFRLTQRQLDGADCTR
jgi:hypothetical protein